MDILFCQRKRRRRNFYDSDSYDYMYIDLLDESFTDSMDQDSDMSESDTSRSRVSTPELQLPSLPLGVPTLMDSAVKIVAKHVSCAEIENHNPPVDESMLKKIAFWAFPQDESHVKVFSQLTLQAAYEWNYGERRFNEGMIKKIRQVGFMVSAFVGTVRDKQESKVSLTFEKQHLTSTSCSACSDVVFCQHIIAVILERIRHAKKVPIHAPVTETLSTLTRDQLQKLLQYAINEDPGGVLGRVFQHIDEIRDINSDYNKLDGAPDPTFGMLPDEKSTWDISLQKMKKKLVTELDEVYTSFYKDTCDLFVKSKSSFHEKYFKRVTELINIDEVESAGKVLMTIADTTFNVLKIRWSSSTKRVFLDVERMLSCFITCFTGQIRLDMIQTALTINKAVVKTDGSGPTYLVPKQWSEMSSIKLHDIGEENLSVVHAMQGQENKPFYEPLIASQLSETPEILRRLFNKEGSISETVYEEPLDVMLFRFDCLVQYYQWTDDTKCPYKMCVLGTFILKKLLLLSENYSIITFDDKRMKVLKDLQEKEEEDMESQEKEICEPPAAKRPRRSRAYTTKRKKGKDQKKTPSQRMNDAIHKIKEDMRRATEDKTFDGLSQAQMCYSMLYVCFKMWQTMIVSNLDSSIKILFEATFRVFELSRFRYGVAMEIKEASWWGQLMDNIQMYLGGFVWYNEFKVVAQRYSQALLQSKLDFYDEYLPLPLIDLLQTNEIPYTDQLKLAVNVLCYSKKPIYQFEFLSAGHDYSSESEKVQLRNDVIKKYKTLLSQVFAVKSELPEQSEAAKQVLWHLESVQDGEYVVVAYNCIKKNVENIVEKEDKLVLLTVLLNCIKECVLHEGLNGLYSHGTSVSDTLLFLSKSLAEEFPKRVLPLWTEMCKYFNKYQLKSLLNVVKESVIEKPSLITGMASTVQKYFTSPFKHDRECCKLLTIFFPTETKRHQMLKKIATNSSNYTACALLKIGKTEYEILAKSNPSLNVFCKQVFDFLMLGLKTLKDKHHVGCTSSSLYLNSKEMKYLRWYFGMLAASLSKDIIKGEEFMKLMLLLKEVLKQDVNLMLDFYQAMEVSLLGLKETKSQLGSELVCCYLRKFHTDLRNCNHTHYSKVLDEMKMACKECDLYVPNGAVEFGDQVFSILRHTYRGKKKLVQLMDEAFPNFVVSKKTKKSEKK